MKKRLFILLGFLNVGLGVAGIFLPLLPTTPFLLLAAYLFARSSARWNRWLLNHRRLGPYIHAFRNKTGLTRQQKWRIAASFSLLMGLSLYFVPLPPVRWVLGAMWLFWMTVIVFSRTAPEVQEEAIPVEE
jgi:uncharacterized membrane protein YbaN (DUF454 family)